jgi:asparagine synthase (glutamine-hydrolysing)
VILRAYEEWGVDCVRRLRVMFAFAICDRRKSKEHQGKANARSSRLFLARDPIGKKPLFYYQDDEQLKNMASACPWDAGFAPA